jgi:hypothetical protein
MTLSFFTTKPPQPAFHRRHEVQNRQNMTLLYFMASSSRRLVYPSLHNFNDAFYFHNKTSATPIPPSMPSTGLPLFGSPILGFIAC